MIRTSSWARRATASALAAALGLASAPVICADNPVEPVKVTAVAHFDFDAARLREQEKPALLADVGKMKNVSWQSVTATGYTDSVGSVNYNRRLSSQRARAVKEYLVGKGIDPAMIRTVAEAEDAPVADNKSPAGRARNRRTEIVFEGVRAP